MPVIPRFADHSGQKAEVSDKLDMSVNLYHPLILFVAMNSDELCNGRRIPSTP